MKRWRGILFTIATIAIVTILMYGYVKGINPLTLMIIFIGYATFYVGIDYAMNEMLTSIDRVEESIKNTRLDEIK